MHPYIAVGLPYISLKSYVRYRVVPKANLDNAEMIIERILMTISVEMNIPKSQILSKSRAMPERDARHIAMHLIRKKSKLPLVRIGKVFNRDHSTVINSLKSVDGWLLHNKKFNRVYTELEKLI
jgi:chromosomal replication initiation ATPase DnaA